jgi:hypothetical protein
MNRRTLSLPWCAFAVLFCLNSLSTPTAHSQITASVAQANLTHLVDNAQTIVQGHVVSAVLEPHPQFENLQTVLVKVAVAKTFKGPAAPTITFRQFVWNVKDAGGAGGYQKSEELILFLNPPSLYGLTSPVGMEQGHFRVTRDVKGNRYAENGRGNLGLFTDVQDKAVERGAVLSPRVRTMMAKNGGKVPVATLEETIQVLAAVRP